MVVSSLWIVLSHQKKVCVNVKRKEEQSDSMFHCGCILKGILAQFNLARPYCMIHYGSYMD